VAVDSHATRTLSPLGLELNVLAFLPHRWILAAALPWPKWSQINLPVCCPFTPLLTSHTTPPPPPPPSINKTLHTHSLTNHSTSTDASNEITIYSTLQVSNSLCANAGLQDKYTYETRHLESFHPHCDLRSRSALDSATAFRLGPANGLIIAPFPDFLFLLDPMSYDY
jgi:hypothetical protein